MFIFTAFIHALCSVPALPADSHLQALTGGRPSLEVPFFEYQIQTGLSYGEVYVGGHGGRIEGVIVVFGPGQDFARSECSDGTHSEPSNAYVAKLPSEMQQWWQLHIRPKYAELMQVSLGGVDARRSLWHIRLLAVHPKHQRNGVGRGLMDGIMRKANAGRQRMCLEVYNDRLVRHFTRLGFRVKGTKNFSSYQGGFPLFCMVREPC
ncbi:hypothetical protein BD410DRAFT_812004 [Rickenella mellea]|uniref:N-acetyltransferase domain-containing protein n=1 Tax=Rickenella mellea TaxID=50990 RepID=A0A4Y7QJJ8_9AGAM|nr:hypothetical protein BD410DRAFT_812004 [Rickenella mellea]